MLERCKREKKGENSKHLSCMYFFQSTFPFQAQVSLFLSPLLLLCFHSSQFEILLCFKSVSQFTPSSWTWTPHGTYFAVSVPPPFPFSKMLVPAQLTSPPALVPFPLEHVISLPAQSTAARTFCLRDALKAHLIMSASSQSYAPPAQSSTTHHCLPS